MQVDIAEFDATRVTGMEMVQAAGMEAITKAIQDNTPERAGWVLDILERMSIV